MTKDRPETPEGPAPGEGGEQPSFVRRLHEQYGKQVDPQIHLQEDVGPEEEGRGHDHDSSSGSSRGLVRRLADQTPSGDLRYALRDEIGRGGMGTVLRVWDDDLRRNLAMKVMHGRTVPGEVEEPDERDQERLGRFLEEAQITGQLDHPGVVPVHDLGIDAKGRCYFTMRLVRGRELKEVLDLTREGKEGWTTTKALGVILKVCEAMAFAHSKGVVHRDLKPSNVMVGRFGETYVMDWGLARVLGRRDTRDIRLKRAAEDPSMMSLVRTARSDESLSNPDSPLVTMDGDVVGTPSFMSLEQAMGKLDEIGPSADVYSLGAILYYLLTGKAPYVEKGERISPHAVLNRVLSGPPDPVRKLAKHAPDELVAICEKAMARDVRERYATMLEVADDIQAFLENRVVRAYEAGSLAEARKWIVRNKGVALALTGLLLTALGSAMAFGVQKSRQVDAIQLKQKELTDAMGRVERSEEDARRNLELALERQAEAAQNARRAFENENLARASGYRAKVTAASASLDLNDVAKASKLLAETPGDLRGWEHDHLMLRADPASRTFDAFENVAIDDVAYHGDERILAINRSGKLYALDPETGDPVEPSGIFEWASPLRPQPRNLATSSDGRLAALAGADNTVSVYELSTGEEVHQLEHAEDRLVTSVDFARDGRLVTGDDAGTLLVWDVAEERVVHRLQGGDGRIAEAAWGPSGLRLAVASDSTTVTVWDVAAGSVVQKLRASRRVRSLDWHPHGQALVTGGDDGELLVWNAREGFVAHRLPGHVGRVLDARFSPVADDHLIVSAGADKTVREWRYLSGESRSLLGHDKMVTGISFRQDGLSFLSCSEDGTVKLWRTSFLPHLTQLGDRRNERGFLGDSVLGVAVHPDGRHVVETRSRQTFMLWDSYTQEVLRVFRGHEAYVSGGAFTRDGRRFVSWGGDAAALLWDVESGLIERRFEGAGNRIRAAALAPDDSFLLLSSDRGRVQAFDLGSGEVRFELSGFRDWCKALAISADGARIASGGSERSIYVWEPGVDEPVQVLAGHDRRGIRCLAFSHDRALLAAGGSQDGIVKLWDLESGELRSTLSGHTETVRSVAFNEDSTRLASGSADGTVRIWDVLTGEVLVTLEEAHNAINEVAFDAAGRRLVAGSADGLVRIWETGGVEERSALRMGYVAQRAAVEGDVERLFNQHFFHNEVRLRIGASPAYDEEERQVALRLAAVRGDNPGLLDAHNRVRLLDPELSEQERALCLRRALAVCSMDRNQHRYQVTLAVAQYRNGELQEARESIDRAFAEDELRRSGRSSVSSPWSMEGAHTARVYRALIRHAQGETREARLAWAELEQAYDGSTRLQADSFLSRVMEEAHGVFSDGG